MSRTMQEKLLDYLREGGAQGRRVTELAELLYGTSDYETRGLVNQLVQSVRKKGFKVQTVISFDGLRCHSSRYILVESATAGVPNRDDEPSWRESGSEHTRGSR